MYSIIQTNKYYRSSLKQLSEVFYDRYKLKIEQPSMT